MRYWLMKSEPDVFSIQQLQRKPKQRDNWNGVRNYQARNFMREMRKGDLAFFYHSSCPQPGIVGVIKIAREAYPDSSALNPRSEYYDPKHKIEKPRWFTVDVKLVKIFADVVSLTAIKARDELRDMRLVQPGSRLSVMPVRSDEWHILLGMVKK